MFKRLLHRNKLLEPCCSLKDTEVILIMNTLLGSLRLNAAIWTDINHFSFIIRLQAVKHILYKCKAEYIVDLTKINEKSHV